MSDLLIEAKSLNMDALFQAAAGKAFDTTMDRMTRGTKSEPGNGYSYSSIAKAASKLIAVFPVITSRSVSAETAQMTSKYIEQVACQFIMLALQQANIDTAQNGIEYLKKFHQNMDIGGNGVDAVIGAMDSWIAAYNAGKLSESSSISSHFYNEMTEEDLNFDSLLESDTDLEISSRDIKALMEVMKANENLKFYDTQLNPISINDYSVNEFADGTYHVSIKPYALDEARGSRKGLRSEYRDLLNRGYYYDRDEAEQAQADNDADDEKYYEDKRRRQEERDRKYSSARDYNRERERQEDKKRADAEHAEDRTAARDDRTLRNRWAKEDRDRQDRERKDTERARVASGKNISILKDQEIKKMNDAVPSMLVVRFFHQYTDDEGQVRVSTVPTEFIIGVKSKIVAVTSEEVLRRIMNDNKDGKKFLKFMRTITGELKASDVIFGLSRIKDDVKSCRVKGAYGDMWNLLSNRAKAAHEQVRHGQRNDFSAISTLVISQYDADELFREENFDISDPKNAYHFMQSYNLMAFAIADDATESLKILFDNDTKQFEEISYRMLERETQDGTYKKLINLMAASK